ncbi:MAG TPA: universal stress protein [Methylomirabilota bacterium]|nr:universal stress protein [Methylomirabilota bacterium]
MKRLLIAYDGSPAADAAINDLSCAALPPELDVTVMSVADVYLPPNARTPEAAVPEIPPLLVQRAREKALQTVNAHRALAEGASARIKTMFPKWNCIPCAVGDSPGWAIARKAMESKIDLVVLGSQSHSRLERIFLGSVSHKVAAEAPCSVRIGRHHAASDALHIIVAVDGSLDSKAALQEVASRAWRPGTHFRLVTIVDSHLETAMTWPGFAPENFMQSNDESGREWINRMAEAASRILFDAGLNVSNYVYDGDPKDVLVRVSKEWQADAIFLGARGLNHGNHLSLGTVASSVASRAHCSVELVRPPRG